MVVYPDRQIASGPQKGAALMVALMILIGVTVISLAGINNSVIGLRIAATDEVNMNTFQTAQAALDFAISDSNNLPTSGPLNQPATVTIPSSLTVTHGVFEHGANDRIDIVATRIGECAPPPRARMGSSLNAYSAFHYDVSVEIDKTKSGMGQEGMAQGYILLGPKC